MICFYLHCWWFSFMVCEVSWRFINRMGVMGIAKLLVYQEDSKLENKAKILRECWNSCLVTSWFSQLFTWTTNNCFGMVISHFPFFKILSPSPLDGQLYSFAYITMWVCTLIPETKNQTHMRRSTYWPNARVPVVCVSGEGKRDAFPSFRRSQPISIAALWCEWCARTSDQTHDLWRGWQVDMLI